MVLQPMRDPSLLTSREREVMADIKRIWEHLSEVQNSPDWADLDEVLSWYRGDVSTLLVEVERLTAASTQVTGLLPPQCATCQGRGWVMKSEHHDLGNGLSSGGAWNEPCPDCAPARSPKETP